MESMNPDKQYLLLQENKLKHKANHIRKNLVDQALKTGSEHISPSLSCVDILVALYYNVMNIDKNNWENRDRFILSKGHGCYGVYSILNDKGFLPDNEWDNFNSELSSLKGCIERDERYGIEASGGSLGHGLPIATGIAFGAKLQKLDYNIYCLIGDGELQEGSMWEAIQFAVKHKLSNLNIIVDANGLQAMDFIDDVLVPKGKTDDISQKLHSFGCIVAECDGHNPYIIAETVKKLNCGCCFSNKAPKAIVARTVKGYGLLCMENVPKFHYRRPTEEELNMGKRYE